MAVHFGKLVHQPKQVVPSFVRLKPSHERHDVRRDLFAAAPDSAVEMDLNISERKADTIQRSCWEDSGDACANSLVQSRFHIVQGVCGIERKTVGHSLNDSDRVDIFPGFAVEVTRHCIGLRIGECFAALIEPFDVFFGATY